VIRYRPDVYLRAVRESITLFMSPSTDYAFVDANRVKIYAYDRFVNEHIYRRSEYLARAGLGSWPRTSSRSPTARCCSCGWRFSGGTRGRIGLTILFLVFTVLYASVLSCLTETGENQRQRFFLDPLVLAVVAAGMRDIFLWVAGALPRCPRPVAGLPGLVQPS